MRYVWVLLLVLLVGGAVCAWWQPIRISPVTLVCLLLLSVAAEMLLRVEFGRSSSGSVLAVVVAAAVPLVGPLGAAAVGALPTLINTSRGSPVIARVFNTAQQGLIGLTGGLVYLAAGGETTIDHQLGVTALLGKVFFPMLVATAVMMLVNGALLAGIIRLAEGMAFRSVFLETLMSAWLIYLGYGVASFLFVDLWQVEQIGPLSLLLVIAPLLLAHWSIGRQADEREARLRTVRTLVAAAETRGAQRLGQSERVADVSAAVGEELRLSPARAEVLQFAAAVHNVGLITPPGKGADAFTAEQVLAHPARGVEMLAGIDFLDDARAAVRHHHERWDGRGYPTGLAGTHIPMLARIIAVADVYVALTWGEARLSSEEALALIRARSGTQFDPSCVQALERASTRGRVVDLPPPEGREPEHDHDDPQFADRLLDQAHNR